MAKQWCLREISPAKLVTGKMAEKFERKNRKRKQDIERHSEKGREEWESFQGQFDPCANFHWISHHLPSYWFQHGHALPTRVLWESGNIN
jgi:hypothetical protein